jgi:dihydrofolate reductase
MKITLIVATSRDGFINPTGGKIASDWTSEADQKHYSEILQWYKLQLMGLNTYEAYKDRFKPSSLYHRVIFTYHPEDYKDIPGKMEFTNEPIETALHRLEGEGFRHAALLGGGILFTEFLEAGLVDEAYQTIEPLEFGSGIPFLTGGRTMADFAYLRRISTTPLNDEGTVLVRYLRK